VDIEDTLPRTGDNDGYGAALMLSIAAFQGNHGLGGYATMPSGLIGVLFASACV
jgi:hypothetical protein